MAQLGFNFSTADFDCLERGVVGSAALGPRVKLKMGLALFRAIYEYREAGLTAGDLQASPQIPDINLAIMANKTQIQLVQGANSVIFDPGDNAGTNTYDYLMDNHDAEDHIVICLDATSPTAAVACPEIKTWCEALGGNYTKF